MYSTKFLSCNLTITLSYDRDLWKDPTSIETPFWVGIRNAEWKQVPELNEKVNRFPEHYKQIFWGMIFLALEPLQDATLQEVSEDMKRKILTYIKTISV